MYVYIIIITVFLTCRYTSVSAQTMKEIELHGINRANLRQDDNKLNVSLKLDTIQNQSADGLKFSIKISNNSTENITVKNILNFLQLTLFDESGNNIAVKQVPRALINTNKNLTGYEAFKIHGITSNNKSIDAAILSKPSLTIPAKGNYEIILKIQNILMHNDGISANVTSMIPGKYKLGITLSLIGDKSSTSTIFQPMPLTVYYN